jgi:hypothetical protein
MKRLAVVALTVLLFVARGSGSASAHPLGADIINRYAGLDTYKGMIRLTYMLDYGWLATSDNLPAADTNHDGQYSPDELQVFAERVRGTYDIGLRLTAGTTSLNLVPQTAALVMRRDPNGFPTMKLTFVYDAALPQRLSGPVQLEFEDQNFEDNYVWKEIAVRSTEGSALTIPPDVAVERSQQLDAYPPLDGITIPNQDKADWTWQAGTGVPAPSLGQPAAPAAAAAITPGPAAISAAAPRSSSFLDLRVVLIVAVGLAAFIGVQLMRLKHGGGKPNRV